MINSFHSIAFILVSIYYGYVTNPLFTRKKLFKRFSWVFSRDMFNIKLAVLIEDRERLPNKIFRNIIFLLQFQFTNNTDIYAKCVACL